jgi:hypothetical protein
VESTTGSYPGGEPADISSTIAAQIILIGGEGRNRAESPIQITRKIAIFPQKIKKDSPELATILHYFWILSLTVSFFIPGLKPMSYCRFKHINVCIV